MPKLKTKKAMKKRFRITKNGKVLVSKSFRRHLLADRSPKRKRQARGWHVVDPTDVKRITKGLPYDR
ncbi:MAG: 50S ribosomal protein L35 [Candidatus Omnitrophica bacterium]|nr:50S ribosomal protein L35 [Candidatus Omnitrophota bacterium]